MHYDVPPPAPESGPSALDEDFGPWMIVEKRKRNLQQSNYADHVNHVNHTNQVPNGSPPIQPTMNPIFEEVDNTRVSTLKSRETVLISAPHTAIQPDTNAGPLIDVPASHLIPLQGSKSSMHDPRTSAQLQVSSSPRPARVA
ncbi:hypothetical protein V6N12_024332 [Hibiscus sabdariffa]|uniref:Uncharacterized protein n=1 Tax=Hibiscus sabdariffa TaxID=183260 RepID=A0ABR2G0R2_9ROSI